MISIGAKNAAMQQDGSAPQGLQAPCDGHAQAVECLYEICNLIFLVQSKAQSNCKNNNVT
jgi:hypothetical protein